MKGIILSGGNGTRLHPITKIVSKQLLPIWDRPMIYYPLKTLIDAGIEDILIIVAPEHAESYKKYLGSGEEFGANITFAIQDKPEGLPQAYVIGAEFIGADSVAMILGDNIFEDSEFLSGVIKEFKGGGHVFGKAVPDPNRFGVIKFDADMKVREIVEKPKEFVSEFAQVGLYIFDNRVSAIAKALKPSARGEYEIVDVSNWYLNNAELKVTILEGEWFDAGTFESLHRAQQFAYEKSRKETNGHKKEKND